MRIEKISARLRLATLLCAMSTKAKAERAANLRLAMEAADALLRTKKIKLLQLAAKLDVDKELRAKDKEIAELRWAGDKVAAAKEKELRAKDKVIALAKKFHDKQMQDLRTAKDKERAKTQTTLDKKLAAEHDKTSAKLGAVEAAKDKELRAKDKEIAELRTAKDKQLQDEKDKAKKTQATLDKKIAARDKVIAALSGEGPGDRELRGVSRGATCTSGGSGNSQDGSASSCATSAISLEPSRHCATRQHERDITHREMQSARKHGVPRATQVTQDGRVMRTYPEGIGGVTIITKDSRVITAWREGAREATDIARVWRGSVGRRRAVAELRGAMRDARAVAAAVAVIQSLLRRVAARKLFEDRAEEVFKMVHEAEERCFVDTRDVRQKGVAKPKCLGGRKGQVMDWLEAYLMVNQPAFEAEDDVSWV